MNARATLLRPGQLAAEMGVSVWTIHNWTCNGTIPSSAVVRIGSSHQARYKRAVLEQVGLLTKPLAVSP